MASSKLSFSLGARKRRKLGGPLEDEGEDEAEESQRDVSGGEPSPPAEEEVKRACERLADFIADSGEEMEAVARSKNGAQGPFAFLFDQTSKAYKYYRHCLSQRAPTKRSEEQDDGKQQADESTGPAGAEQARHTHSQERQGIVPAREEEERGNERCENEDGEKETEPEPIGSDEIARAATQREDEDPSRPLRRQGCARVFTEKGEGSGSIHDSAMSIACSVLREEEEEEEALAGDAGRLKGKEKGVARWSGAKGQHLSDFLPKDVEEAALGSSKSGQGHAEGPALDEGNKGRQMLSKMGWKEGRGLGAEGSGRVEPLSGGSASGPGQRAGLGNESRQEPSDEYERYRKRMQLAYRYRPNPLGNPRKHYY